MGPKIKPGSPNIEIPPMVEKRIIRSCIFRSLPTNLGRKMLSKMPINTAAIPTNIPAPIDPVNIRIMAQGKSTAAVPTLGIIERIIMIRVQNIGLGTPAIQSTMPPQTP